MNATLQNRILGISNRGNTIMSSENGNKHIAITGASGMGKSYLNDVLILQDIKKGVPVVVLDIGNSFSANQLPEIFKNYINDYKVIYDAQKDIGINPFTLKKYFINDEPYIETPVDAARRIAAILSTSISFGDRQYTELLKALISLMEEYDNGETDVVTLRTIYNRLVDTGGYAKGTASRLYAIMNEVKFSENDEDIWYRILDQNNPKVTVFQLSRLDPQSQKMAVNCLLDDLYKYISINGTVDKPFVITIDEFQKISTKSDGQMPIDRLIVEGRKFGASLIMSTQLIDLNKNNKLFKQLDQMSTRIYFKPPISEIPAVAKRLSYNSKLNWKAIINSMYAGCCIVENGDIENELDKLVKVISLEKLIEKL